MTASPQLKADLIGAIPNLRAFAVSLCGNPDRADDLVQETLVKAWSNLTSFSEGTNLAAWLFTILRNIYYDQREALILIGASGLSYEEAAGVCNCAVGTMKSRVNRARNRLIELLSIVSSTDYGADADWQSGLDTLIMGQRFSRTGSD